MQRNTRPSDRPIDRVIVIARHTYICLRNFSSRRFLDRRPRGIPLSFNSLRFVSFPSPTIIAIATLYLLFKTFDAMKDNLKDVLSRLRLPPRDTHPLLRIPLPHLLLLLLLLLQLIGSEALPEKKLLREDVLHRSRVLHSASELRPLKLIQKIQRVRIVEKLGVLRLLPVAQELEVLDEGGVLEVLVRGEVCLKRKRRDERRARARRSETIRCPVSFH